MATTIGNPDDARDAARIDAAEVRGYDRAISVVRAALVAAHAERCGGDPGLDVASRTGRLAALCALSSVLGQLESARGRSQADIDVDVSGSLVDDMYRATRSWWAVAADKRGPDDPAGGAS